MSNSNSTILKSSLGANNEMVIFDRGLKRRHFARADMKKHGFLFEEASTRLLHHMEGLTKSFPDMLEFEPRVNFISQKIENKFGIKKIKSANFSGDGEIIDIKPESSDLIISLLNLHWVNDLPGCLIQLHDILRKDGLLLASMLGGGTLNELRTAMIEVEIKLSGGTSPRISPFADARDAAGLLQRTKFAMPVADTETITVLYKGLMPLLKDLRGMGETNALIKRNRKYPGRDFFNLVEKKYMELFGNEKGEIPGTFEIITLSGTKN